MRLACALAVTGTLSGCAALPAKEAAGFRDIAVARSTEFAGFTRSEREARRDYVAMRAEAPNSLDMAGKCKPGFADDPKYAGVAEDTSEARARDVARVCQALLVDGGAVLPTAEAARETRALAAAIGLYGARMAELAEAQDIEAAQASVAGAGAAIKSLAKTVGLFGFDVVVDLGVRLARYRYVEQRRAILLTRAREATDPVRFASARMGVLATHLRDNQVSAINALLSRSRDDLRDLQDAEAAASRTFQSAGPGDRLAADAALSAVRARRMAKAREVVDLADRYAATQAMPVDFSSLDKGHRKLVDALANPRVPLDEALTQLNEFAVLVGQLGGEEDGSS